LNEDKNASKNYAKNTIILGETEVSGQTTLHLFFRGRKNFGTYHLFFRGRKNFGQDGGERARPLNIYIFEVLIILGETEVRARPLYIYIFEVVIIFGTLHLFFRGRNNFGQDCGERARPLYIYFFEVVIFLG
jgi:hypothetical protein